MFCSQGFCRHPSSCSSHVLLSQTPCLECLTFLLPYCRHLQRSTTQRDATQSISRGTIFLYSCIKVVNGWRGFYLLMWISGTVELWGSLHLVSTVELWDCLQYGRWNITSRHMCSLWFQYMLHTGEIKELYLFLFICSIYNFTFFGPEIG